MIRQQSPVSTLWTTGYNQKWNETHLPRITVQTLDQSRLDPIHRQTLFTPGQLSRHCTETTQASVGGTPGGIEDARDR